MHYALVRVISYKRDQTYLVVGRDGQAFIVGTDFFVSQKSGEYDFASFVVLHLNKIYASLLKDKSKANLDYPALDALDKEEQTVVNAMRDSERDIDELKISYKDGRVYELAETKTRKSPVNAKSAAKQIDHGEVTIHIGDNQMTHARIVRKRRVGT